MKRGGGPARDPDKIAAWQRKSQEKAAARAQGARKGLARVPMARKPLKPSDRPKREPLDRERWDAAERAAKRCALAGCGTPHDRLKLHHVVYRQHVKRAGGDQWDPANGMPLCFGCHAAHHARGGAIHVGALPTSALVFGRYLLGAAARDYFGRYYVGEMPRNVERILRCE